MTSDGYAFWLAEPGRGEIRPVEVPEPGADEVLVRTRFSGVSRGTETLVFAGRVPPSQGSYGSSSGMPRFWARPRRQAWVARGHRYPPFLTPSALARKSQR